MATYPVHDWSKTSEGKWFEDTKLRSNNDSPDSQNKLPSELEMENEVINSCRSKYFYNDMAYNTLPKKFVVSAWLGVLVGQSWEYFWHWNPAQVLLTFKVFVIPKVYWCSE